MHAEHTAHVIYAHLLCSVFFVVCTKKAIRVCDQSGQQMRFVNVQGLPDQKLKKLLGQRVVSLTLVTPSKT